MQWGVRKGRAAGAWAARGWSIEQGGEKTQAVVGWAEEDENNSWPGPGLPIATSWLVGARMSEE